jgi:hypothetical protein
MTPKPRTNFPESPSHLSFAGSGPLCFKSSLESSSDYHIGLGLVLALASGLAQSNERPLCISSGNHIQSHSVVQSDLFTKCFRYLFNTISLAVETFCTFIPAFQIFPISRCSMLMPASVKSLHGRGIGPRVSCCRHSIIPFAPTKTAGLEERRSCCFDDDPATRLSRQTRASLHSALR